MVDSENKRIHGVYDLVRLMKILRSPDGCPWDAEQTHGSIRRNLLEEAYEAAEAIDEDNTDHMIEELGDVLLQVLFHADIAEESGRFSLDDIADATYRKLIRRHPHVFGDKRASDGGESLVFWEDAKRAEKQQDTTADAMNSVSTSLPGLWRAEKVQKKAAKSGFDFSDYKGALAALSSELLELEASVSSGEGIENELGDLLFSAVNVARFFNIDPEKALSSSVSKFISRFERVERSARDSGRQLRDMTSDEIDDLYQQVKLEG